jgi:BirA family biotin operon repressor/biotin-[acetyl-CoA-carboxylase] ligase
MDKGFSMLKIFSKNRNNADSSILMATTATLKNFNFAVYHEGKVESTQALAKNLYKEQPRDLIVIAKSQTKGVGKQTRPWMSCEGDAIFSLVFHPKGSSEEFAQLCFVMCLAVGRAIMRTAPHASIRYKWINDLLLNGDKVAGILLELLEDGALMIGVGVNLVARGDWQGLEATSLADNNIKVDRAEFIAEVLKQFDSLYDNWLKMGFLAVQNEWLRRAIGINGRISLRGVFGQIEGVFVNIDENGNLLLLADGKIKVVGAGDMFFRGGKNYGKE